MLPWKTLLVAVGDRVTVEFESRAEIFAPSWSHFVVRSADAAPLIWVGDAPSTRELAPPIEFEVRDASDPCTATSQCGSFTRRGYRIAIGEAETAVGYGQQADVGSYTALHLANDQQVSSSGCADWFVAHSGLALVRGSQQELAARDRAPCGDTTCAAGNYCELPPAAGCDPSSADGSCLPAPEECAQDCPGVCGCNGRFYCNACRAAKAGVDVADGDMTCRTPACDGVSTEAGSGGPNCFSTWSCFGFSYEIRCGADGDSAHCTCAVDQQSTGTVERDPRFDCGSGELASRLRLPAFKLRPVNGPRVRDRSALGMCPTKRLGWITSGPHGWSSRRGNSRP